MKNMKTHISRIRLWNFFIIHMEYFKIVLWVISIMLRSPNRICLVWVMQVLNYYRLIHWV